MSQLLDTLIDKGIIGTDTVVTLAVRTRHQTCDYMVLDISRAQVGYRLNLQSIDGGKAHAADSSDVVAIDGMAIERYADVYNINRDGSNKTVGKKRGRKPKIR